MPRYRLTVEYDGTPFVGWQRQAEGKSVQEWLETAIRGFSGESVTVIAAGRTDTGVHATGQVVSFDLQGEWDPFRIREALNYHLRPEPVVVVEADTTDPDFSARHSAIARHYEYAIINRRAPSAIERNTVWHVAKPLDADAMGEAAATILGRHDFTTFRSAQCQANSPVRTLDKCEVMRLGERILIACSARSFLHNQVRSMVGSLKLVGEGKWRVRDMRRALDAQDRAACGPVAPARGLTLVKVDYR